MPATKKPSRAKTKTTKASPGSTLVSVRGTDGEWTILPASEVLDAQRTARQNELAARLKAHQNAKLALDLTHSIEEAVSDETMPPKGTFPLDDGIGSGKVAYEVSNGKMKKLSMTWE